MPRKGDRISVVGQRARYLYCTCDCGKKKEVALGSIRSGISNSCGCTNTALADATRTHGMSSFGPEYDVWAAMVYRCVNPKSIGYKNYGGRGIKVCERWQDVRNFLADMGHRPSPKHSVERRDNNGDYAPDNCHWGIKDEQVRNTRRNIYFEIDGKRMVMKDAAKHLGMDYHTLRQRIRLGWSKEKAIRTPVDYSLGYNRKKPRI